MTIGSANQLEGDKVDLVIRARHQNEFKVHTAQKSALLISSRSNYSASAAATATSNPERLRETE
jgi:hypothetical protein